MPGKYLTVCTSIEKDVKESRASGSKSVTLTLDKTIHYEKIYYEFARYCSPVTCAQNKRKKDLVVAFFTFKTVNDV